MSKPYRARRYGILNHLGEIWTPETFDNPIAAKALIDAEQRQNPTWDLKRHKVAPVRVTVSAINPRTP